MISGSDRPITRSMAARSKKAPVVDVSTTNNLTPKMSKKSMKKSGSRKQQRKITPLPENFADITAAVLSSPLASLGNPVRREGSQPLSPAVAIESAVELSLFGSPPSPKAAAKKIFAPLSTHRQQGAVDFLPLLPRTAAHGFQKVLHRANMSQNCSERSEAFILKGMSGCQVFNLLGVLSIPGSTNEDGTLMATLASQRYLITDPIASVALSKLMDMHDENSANTWMMHLSAEPEKFSAERQLINGNTDGWDRAVKGVCSMGLTMDAAELCNAIHTKLTDIPIEERAGMVVYIRALVSGAQKAKMALKQGCVVPADDANNRLLCVQVVRLLIFALKIVVGLDVPEWMYVVVSDVEIMSAAFAVAMQEKVTLGWEIDYEPVYAAVGMAALGAESPYSWCKRYLIHKVEESRGLVNPLCPR